MDLDLISRARWGARHADGFRTARMPMPVSFCVTR